MSKVKQIIVEMHEEERINKLLKSGYAFERRLTDRLVILSEDIENADRKLVRLENNLEELQDLLDDGYNFSSHGIFPGRAFVCRPLEQSNVFTEEHLANIVKQVEEGLDGEKTDYPTFEEICKYALSADDIYTIGDKRAVCSFWECDKPKVELLPNRGEIVIGDFIFNTTKKNIKKLMEDVKDIEDKNKKIKIKETLAKIR